MEHRFSWRSDEPWKKKELRSKISAREKQFENQRAEMERKSTMLVKVTCNKSLLLPPGIYKSFTLRLSIPMREPEFLERMMKAFPNLEFIKRDDQ